MRAVWFGIFLSWNMMAQEPFFPEKAPEGLPKNPGRFALLPGFPQEGVTAMFWSAEHGPVVSWHIPTTYSHPAYFLSAEAEDNTLCLRFYYSRNRSILKECFAFRNGDFEWIRTESGDASLAFMAQWREAGDFYEQLACLNRWSGPRPDSMVLQFLPEMVTRLVYSVQNEPDSVYKPKVYAFFDNPVGQELLIWRKKKQARDFFARFGNGGSENHWLLLLKTYLDVLPEEQIHLRLLVAAIVCRNSDFPEGLKIQAEIYESLGQTEKARESWNNWVNLMDKQQRGREVPEEIRRKIQH